MITRRVRLQLLAFALVTVVVIAYGATRVLDVRALLGDGYEVRIQVADPGGLYPRADVDLLGTRVGRVTELEAGPGPATTVVVKIEDGVEIPADVRAVVGSKSAIGEGFVMLEPRSDDGPLLEGGDVIGLEDTVSPTPLDGLLARLDALAASIPLSDLDTVIREAEVALRGIAPSVRQLVSGTETVTADALANVRDTTALLRDARTVLGTQQELGQETVTYAAQLAALVDKIHALDPTLISLYDTGVRASTGVTNLLADNQELLPVLLDNLLTLTTVASDRLPGLKKFLVVFPWILENQVNSARYCDDYDPKTGDVVESTCHYDDEGRPIYSLHLAQQLPKLSPGGLPCTEGYGGTERFSPNGEPVDGTGPDMRPDEPPNLKARCTSKPTDPNSPNVRGAQNVTTPAFLRPEPTVAPGARSLVVYDPASGLLTNGSGSLQIRGPHAEPPPTGPAGLAWLLTHQLTATEETP